jgi:hypothetical protein
VATGRGSPININKTPQVPSIDFANYATEKGNFRNKYKMGMKNPMTMKGANLKIATDENRFD